MKTNLEIIVYILGTILSVACYMLARDNPKGQHQQGENSNSGSTNAPEFFWPSATIALNGLFCAVWFLFDRSQ